MIIHTIMLITTINHVWSSGRPGRQSTWSWVLDGWDPREKVEANHEDQFFHSWHLSDHDDHSNKLLDCWCSSSTLILPPKGGMRSIDRNAWASEAAFQAGIVLLRVALMFRVSFFFQKLKMVFEESSSPGTRIPRWAAARGEHTLRSAGGADERPPWITSGY